MSVKVIVDPTSVRTIWRPPKWLSPYGTDHTADDRARRSSDDKSSSGTEGRANPIRM
jgi:hypothetical protein